MKCVECPHCGQMQMLDDSNKCIKCGKSLFKQEETITKDNNYKYYNDLKGVIESSGEQPGCLSGLVSLVALSGIIAVPVVLIELFAAIFNNGLDFFARNLSKEFAVDVAWAIISIIAFIALIVPKDRIGEENKKRLSYLLSWIEKQGKCSATVLISSPWIAIIDEMSGVFSFFDLSANVKSPQKEIYFQSIDSAEILQNNTKVASIGGAIAGGMIAGGVGAVIGSSMGDSSSSLQLVIYLKDIKDPVYTISFFKTPQKTNSEQYKKAFEFAQHILGVIKVSRR